MFRDNIEYNDKVTGRGVGKMKNTIIIVAVFAFTLCVTGAWASQSTTINMNAAIPVISGGLNVVVSKVIGTTFTEDTSINFGALALHPEHLIFMPSDERYYAVDIGVRDNSGNNWTITHTRNSLKKDATNNLDNNVNVSFVKQKDSNTGTVDKYLSLSDSNNVSYDKTTLGSGWLRIYYGIGTANTSKPDAPGVEPIGLNKAAGTYSGSVTITLAP
jgi:hypothetical protein